MEKDKSSSRLLALDGLRGFAIILVFLNHVVTTHLQRLIPFNLLGWLLGDGVTGVTFLFILSGFLMASIYPNPQSTSAFLQKRYTRIFPLFLTMCVVMLLYHLYPQLSGFLLILTLILALCGHTLWTNVIKNLAVPYKRVIFISFLLTQAIVGSVYLLWIMRRPAIAFAETPHLFHDGMIFLVNATLTLPLGNYIPMLDGVYWSLIAEVLFYILYPTILVPLVQLLRQQPRSIKLFFLTATATFIAGVTLLTYKVLVISMIQPALWIYFVVGIVLAHIYHYKSDIVGRVSQHIQRIGLGQIAFFIGVLLVENIFEHRLSSLSGPWIRMVFSIPLAFLVVLLLDESTDLSKVFRSKWLVLLGTISYSVYLSHALVIHILEQFFKPASAAEEMLFIVSAFTVDILLAICLYNLLEKPYFSRSRDTKAQKNEDHQVKKSHPRLILVTLSVLYIIGIFLVFQSRYNFFSVVKPLTRQPNTGNIILRPNYELTIPFESKEDNLGIIAGTLSHKEQRDGSRQKLLFQLVDSDTRKVIVERSYTLDYFNSGEEFPFGFPVIPNAKDQKYVMRLSLANSASNETVRVNQASFKIIYPANKKELITHPQELAHFLMIKITTVMSAPQILPPLLLGLPFLACTLAVLLRKRRVAIT